MLQKIRDVQQTWIAKAILFAISIPFALWGVETYIRQPGQETVAKVGGEKISKIEFDNAIRTQMDQFRSQFGGQIDASIMDSPEMRKGVLDRLVDQRVLSAATQKVGLSISDNILRDRIFSEASFQENGQFSKARYDIFLKSQGLSELGFESKLRADMAQQQFLQSLSATAIIPKTSVRELLNASEQSREVAVITIAPEQFAAQVKLSPEKVKAFFEEKKKEFTIPEQVRAEYVELSIDALAPLQTVPPEEIAGYYESNKARYVTKEERKASHILINAAASASEADVAAAKAKADGLFAQLKKDPKQFAELAKKNSQDPGSAVNGGDLGFFGRGAMVPPFEKAVFEGKKDELLGPVKSDFGFHIIKVTDIKPEKGKSLADATPEIEGELKKQKASRKFAEIAEKFSNAAYEQSSSLKPAADIAGLPVRQSPWFSKEQAFVPPFNNPKLSKSFFSDDVLKNKRNTEAVEISSSTLVVARALEVKPAVVRPFSEVEQAITQRLIREEASKLAKTDGEAKLAAIKAGKSDLKFPGLLAVSRNSPGGLAGPIVDAALRASPKSLPAFVGVEVPGGGYAIVQVAKVLDLNADESKLAATRQRLQQSLGEGELVATLASLRQSGDVYVSKGATDKPADAK